MHQAYPDETVNILNEIRPASRWEDQGPSALEEAILRTVAYGDVFDFPMTVAEICRYLVGLPAEPQTIRELLLKGARLNHHLSVAGKYICLRGREELTGVRRQREQVARRLWSKARRYGQVIASLPFVRMVAVTGSLAVDNPGADVDIDYLLVAAAGRVWLCRSLAILVVRWASLNGDRLCPNYVLSENRLESSQKDLYNAHEFAQMVPLAGLQLYTSMRRMNRWTFDFLPNAKGLPPRTLPELPGILPAWMRRAAEASLSGRVGSRLEQWEMERKVRRFSQQAPGNDEVGFCADWCKGHFDAHASQSAAAYRDRLAALGLDP